MHPTSEVRNAFLQEAQRQGLAVRRTLPDGRIVLEVNGQDTTVSLENLSRNVARDGDLDAVERFVATVRDTFQPLPKWEQARRGVRYSAEPADHQFGDAIHQPVTDTVARVLVYVDVSEQRIRWLTPQDLKEWGVNRKQADQAAGENMAPLLASAKITVEPIDHHRLGLFDLDSVFKAALIFSPNFKEVVQPKIGWPVYAVVPCRDFAYVFPVKDKDLIPRMGRVVVDEYTKSGYPLTTEVLKISDEGIEAIGNYPAK
jgi:hypothetical protein